MYTAGTITTDAILGDISQYQEGNPLTPGIPLSSSQPSIYGIVDAIPQYDAYGNKYYTDPTTGLPDYDTGTIFHTSGSSTIPTTTSSSNAALWIALAVLALVVFSKKGKA